MDGRQLLSKLASAIKDASRQIILLDPNLVLKVEHPRSVPQIAESEYQLLG